MEGYILLFPSFCDPDQEAHPSAVPVSHQRDIAHIGEPENHLLREGLSNLKGKVKALPRSLQPFDGEVSAEKLPEPENFLSPLHI